MLSSVVSPFLRSSVFNRSLRHLRDLTRSRYGEVKMTIDTEPTEITSKHGESRSMKASLAVLIAGIGLVVAATPLVAHHSFAAEFDANNAVTLKGLVTRI